MLVAVDPPVIVAWRPAVENDLLASGIAATVASPGVVYGHGRGIPALIPGGPRTGSGALTTIGDGHQRWATVHVDDLAELYVLLLEKGSGFGRVIAGGGDNPAVRDLTHAVAGSAGVAPETDETTRARLGAGFADALLLDQRASGGRARALGWSPSRPSLLEEFTNGSNSYRGTGA